MKTNIVYAKLRRIINKMWFYIRDAFRPEWGGATTLINKKDIKGCRADTLVPLANEEHHKPTEPDALQASGPNDAATSPGKCSAEVMMHFEEIARLRQEITVLEARISNQTVVNETLDSLKQLAEKDITRTPGRPPKPHVRILLNLLKEWSLLYELGVQTHVINCDRTSFINTAVKRLIETDYPELYAVYLRSISSINPLE